MSTGLSFAVGHEQLKIFQKLVTELGHAPLGRLYTPKIPRQEMMWFLCALSSKTLSQVGNHHLS